MKGMTHEEVRGLKVEDKLHLIWWDSDKGVGHGDKLFDGLVTVDDVTDMDICCQVNEGDRAGSYVSIMLQAPSGSGAPWLINRAPGRGWFEFFHPTN